MRVSDRTAVYTMKLVSALSLACYTGVMWLCHRQARHPDPAGDTARRRLAYAAHSLDWLMNLLVFLVGVGRLYREQHFGGQYQPRWLKLYFIVTGPLPTLGMLGALLTGRRWGATLGDDAARRRAHRALAVVGYAAWWLSILPMFFQPLLNRAAARRGRGQLSETVER